jgi:hypothetical protein
MIIDMFKWIDKKQKKGKKSIAKLQKQLRHWPPLVHLHRVYKSTKTTPPLSSTSTGVGH